MASSRWHNKSLEPTAERLSATIKAYLRRLNSIVMPLAENLVIGEVPMSEAEKKYEHRETELLPFLPTR